MANPRPPDPILQQGLKKIEADLKFLMDIFAEVLQDLGEDQLASHLPWRDHTTSLSKLQTSGRLSQMLSISFQLLNMVEENVAAQTRRLREARQGAQHEPGLWAHQLIKLRKLGFTEEEIAAALPCHRIEPVLTAHPTEAKRSRVMEQHRHLYLLMVQRENPMWTPAEQEEIRQNLRVNLERLWRTGEIRPEKPRVRDELNNVLYYLREVFPDTIEKLDQRFRQAWVTAGFQSKTIQHPSQRPSINFGTWVGGDRDGHPLVTAEVTRQTLIDLRINALRVLHRALAPLPRRLTISAHLQAPPTCLEKANRKLSEILGPRVEPLLGRYREEPWARLAAMIRARLPMDPITERLLSHQDTPGVYSHPRELIEDLETLRATLCTVGAEAIAQADIDPILRQVSIFGFHSAVLDIRQNSAFHDQALASILDQVGIPHGSQFPHWSPDRRRDFLRAELNSPRPFLPPGTPMKGEAEAVLECHQVLVKHLQQFGREGLGALIVSMTRDITDLMVVYLLARETGLLKTEEGHLICELPVVPLLETIDDLQRGAEILREFLDLDITRKSLERQAALSWPRPLPQPVQQVMIGYSDSNKDQGIFCSQWALHEAQQSITKIASDRAIQVRFFHGRGGTISRGAGPTYRFLNSLPPGTLAGDLRLTEQGETIAQKYANRITATYNLELLSAGTTGITLSCKRHSSPESISPTTLQQLAQWSSQAYRRLLEQPGFIDFFQQATPLDVLELSRIGSRPSRRTGKRSLADLRAIPWVFSWNQARFYLPGWFGVGEALYRLRRQHPEAFQNLKSALPHHPFCRYVLTNVETALASADPAIMQQYASLVSNPDLRDSIMAIILKEYRRTHRLLKEIFGGSFRKRRPRMATTLYLREEPLKVLHTEQVRLLRQWRNLQDQGEQAEASALLPELLLSINAIAGGLRTTG